MSVALRDVLTLVGRLDDSQGLDTPRERFRRFIDDRVADVAVARELLNQCQEALGDQHARARQDLVVVLGRFLGFDVTFGTYEPRAAARVGGHWRSRRQARIVLDIRSEQTPEADVDELARTVAALTATAPADAEERWVGLCVTTPFYAARRRLETLLGQLDTRDIRCVTLDSLLWLCDMATSGRIEHADVVRLLTSGPDSDFMIDLMRRLTETTTPKATIEPPLAWPAPQEAPKPSPPLGLVEVLREPVVVSTEVATEPDRSANAEHSRATGFWLAHLDSDENASPELVLHSVIGRRQVLGISDAGGFPPAAKPGDWVCFYIEDAGVVGHAQLDTIVSDATAMIRGARRFSAVFRLQHVGIYDVPSPVAPDSPIARLAARRPPDALGAFLEAISRDDYELVTSASAGRSRATAI
jgi:hypothetical protein